MTVIEISKFRETKSMPLVAFVDLQREYISTGRAYAIEHIEGCLDNCQALLRHARSMRLPIAHFRLIQDSPFFNAASRFTDWIEEFRPKSNEMVFDRSLPSCYSNEGFSNFLQRIKSPTIILAGLTAPEACLSTAVDARHRGHKLVFVQDASASQAIGDSSEADSHAFLGNLIGLYAEVATTGDLTRELTRHSMKAS